MTPSVQLAANMRYAKSLIRTIPDYPEVGIEFRDITPLLADGLALRTVTEALAEQFGDSFDVVAGVEARGFLFAGAVGTLTHTGVIPIRKAGKLPQVAHRVQYAKEYGTDVLEVSPDLRAGMRVLVLDDILATGGTLQAAVDLVEYAGATVTGVGVVLELDGLGGRAVLPDAKALFTM